MTTDLITVEDAHAMKLREELHSLQTDELRDQLAGQLQLTAEHLLRLALIIRELEERGEDLSDLRLGLMPYLRRIAHGQIAPEIVVRYAGFPALIQRIASYALPDQRRIARGEPVELAVRTAAGEITTRKIDPLHLSREQMHLVFAGDHVREAAEQIAILESEPRRRSKRKPANSRVKADSKRGGLILGRAFAPLEDVLAALAELADADFDDTLDEGEQTVVVKLSTGEHRQLKVRAARSHSTMQRLVRRAMAAAGLFRGAQVENEGDGE